MMFKKAEAFYAESLRVLQETKLPFLLGGTLAVNVYTGINRPTKDMDIFCKAGDFPRILQAFENRDSFRLRGKDERWLAKVHSGRYFFDIIFNSANAMTPVTDQWFEEAQTRSLYDLQVQIAPPTELIWSKVFVQDRYKYDGCDVNHLILTQSDLIDWKRLMAYAEQYWEVLLDHVLNFRFVYPSERERIPRWVLDELLNRLHTQIGLPTPEMKVCRGRLYSRDDYAIDVKK